MTTALKLLANDVLLPTGPEPVVSCECEEKGGKIVRHVYPMQWTLDNLRTFWNKSLRYPTLFEKEVNEDFNAFLNIFVSINQATNDITGHGLVWYIDDFVGVFYMDKISNYDATVHFSFFDGRIRGRDLLAREMIKYVFEHYGFQRLTCEIPGFVNEVSRRFVKHIGFTQEGVKRSSSPYQGKYYDCGIYGILRSEVLK